MKIKRFEAKNFREALAFVKKEMGDNAVILSSEELKGPGPRVEITAAVDYDLAGPGTRDGMTCPPSSSPIARREETPTARGEGRFSELRGEIERLKSAVEDMQDKGHEMNLPERKKKVIRHLAGLAVREDLAVRLCEGDVSYEALKAAISKEIATCRDVADRKVVVVVGPTGAGKTTTVAKLSARAIKRGKKVAMINLDTYRIGAIEQTRIYAGIMGVPFGIAASTEELRSGLDKFRDRDTIFVDTTGRNPKDTGHIDELLRIYEFGLPVETHLMVPANSDSDFITESYKRYKRLPIDCIGFTKVDEAVRFGPIYTLSRLCGKPIGYITTGQRVPQDIEFPDRERLAGMVLGKGAA